MACNSHTIQARMRGRQSHRSAISLVLSCALRMTPLPRARILRESHFIRELHRLHLAPPLQKRSSQPGGPRFPGLLPGQASPGPATQMKNRGPLSLSSLFIYSRTFGWSSLR